MEQVCHNHELYVNKYRDFNLEGFLEHGAIKPTTEVFFKYLEEYGINIKIPEKPGKLQNAFDRYITRRDNRKPDYFWTDEPVQFLKKLTLFLIKQKILPENGISMLLTQMVTIVQVTSWKHMPYGIDIFRSCGDPILLMLFLELYHDQNIAIDDALLFGILKIAIECEYYNILDYIWTQIRPDIQFDEIDEKTLKYMFI